MSDTVTQLLRGFHIDSLKDAVITTLAILSVVVLLRNARSRQPHPPGPFELPLIGNLLHLPLKSAWYKLTLWKEQYGDLVFLRGLGQHILVLNSREAITDLLEQRPSTYSHRPRMIMAGDLMGLGQSMPLLHYGQEWRAHRKLAFHALSPSAVLKYEPIQADLAALLCQELLKDPEDFVELVRLVAGRIIITITYGISVKEADSSYIKLAEETMEVIGRATIPGAYSVEILPFLRHLPKWSPFIKFHKDAVVGRKLLFDLVGQPFEHVIEEVKRGTAGPSFTRDMLMKESVESPNKEGSTRISNDIVLDNETLERIRWTSGAMYGAAGESTYATVLTFIMVMALNPEKQKLAHEEMDAVLASTGSDFPNFTHKPSLPYLDAVIKETTRWHPALPLGIARRTARSDNYRGHFIPADTIVIPNVWAIAMDPNPKYPVEAFIPERHMDTDVKTIDPRSYAFGFGRRLCPGQKLGENSVFIITASLLACFDFFPPVNEKGQEVPLIPLFAENLVSYPEPFKCRIVPRDASRKRFIEERVSASTNV